jgi:hypothetical protein
LVTIVKNTATYLHDNKIKNFVLMDRSARPAYIGVREAWRRMYPDEPMPDIYFLNPTGFVNSDIFHSMGETGLSKGFEIVMDGLRKENDIARIDPTGPRTQEEIEGEFKQTYRRLLGNKSEPTLIFDTCIHSGDSIRPVRDSMRGMGFDQLRVGVVDAGRNESEIHPDFKALNTKPLGVCFPFDHDRVVERRFNASTSLRNDDPVAIETGADLRSEIKRIVDQGLGPDPKVRMAY